MDAILFLHYLPLHDPLSRKHLALIRALNPACDVIPVCFNDGRPADPHWRWKNADIIVYDWFVHENPKHERFFLLEHDTFCSQSVGEFYAGVYDKPVAASMVVRPWSTEILPNNRAEPERMKDWHWFTHNESAELYPYLRGMVPVSGVMLRRDALFNMVQLWKTNRDFERLISEARMGTLACMAGYEPVEIRPQCWNYITSSDVDIDQGPGIYHRVRV